MVARCPHYRSDCEDAESKNCLYIKNTTNTATALASLYTLQPNVAESLRLRADHLFQFLQQTEEQRPQTLLEFLERSEEKRRRHEDRTKT